jgi:hypothetical protein
MEFYVLEGIPENDLDHRGTESGVGFSRKGKPTLSHSYVGYSFHHKSYIRYPELNLDPLKKQPAYGASIL